MFKENEIRLIASWMVEKVKSELDIWKVPEDLGELFKEIETALNEHGTNSGGLMAEYCSLMQKEADMFDPYKVYLAGQAALGGDRDNALMNHIREVLTDSSNKQMLSKRDNLFYELCDTLKDDERRLLLTDYNEVFRQYNNTVNRSIHQFFDLGYYHIGNIPYASFEKGAVAQMVRNLGIIRNIDANNRITIPMEIVKSWEIEPGSPLQYLLYNDEYYSGVLIIPYQISCCFCKSKFDLKDYMNHKICCECMAELAKLPG